ncbi:MAG TPA: transcriptional regulator GcvA [Candidatus Competibacteraceae bacterium]|nr:transcriptional regulator GcvA [Candidatus Competibacteraceae bacterium]
MPRRLPPLNAIRAFEAAARHLGFSRAAEELHVTHGAISRQVKQLEDWLGQPLFQRRQGRVALTEAGRELLAISRHALDLLADGSNRLRREARQGPLALACPGSFLMRWLIPRLDRLKAAYPELDLRLSAAEAPPDFAAAGIDTAISVGAPPWPAGLEAVALYHWRFGPVLSPRLSGKLTLRSPADLAGQPLLHTASRPQAWREWAERVGLDPVLLVQGSQFEHLYYMLEAAIAGIGIAIAPEPLVAQDLAAGRLLAPLGFVDSGQVFALLIPWERVADPRIDSLRRWLLAEAAT